MCFAAPIRDYRGAVVGTVGISVLTLYFTKKRMNEALRSRLQAMRTDPDSSWTDPDLKDLAA